MEEWFTRPVMWFLGVILALVGYIWRRLEGQVNSNRDHTKEVKAELSDKIKILEDKLSERYYKKEEVRERIGFAVEPIHSTMASIADSLQRVADSYENDLKGIQKSLLDVHKDLAAMKARMDKDND